MRKKRIKPFTFNKIYNKKELKEHIDNELQNDTFERHCNEVANNLSIDPQIVKDLLKDNSFQVLSLIQESVLKEKEIRINIFGYFYFQTYHIRYVFDRIMTNRRLFK